jgi:hypothetical protein
MTETDPKLTWSAWVQRQLEIHQWSVDNAVARTGGAIGRNAWYRWIKAENVPVDSKRVQEVADAFGADPREAFEAAQMAHLMDVSGDVVIAADPAEVFVRQIRARHLPAVVEDRLIAEVRREIAQRREALEAMLDTLTLTMEAAAEGVTQE